MKYTRISQNYLGLYLILAKPCQPECTGFQGDLQCGAFCQEVERLRSYLYDLRPYYPESIFPLGDRTFSAAPTQEETAFQQTPPVEEAPLVSDWAQLTRTRNVVVVPFFVSDGLHSYEDIPALLGIDPKSPNGAPGKHHEVQGRALFYGTAIGTDPGIADVIIDQAVAFDREREILESPS